MTITVQYYRLHYGLPEAVLTHLLYQPLCVVSGLGLGKID